MTNLDFTKRTNHRARLLKPLGIVVTVSSIALFAATQTSSAGGIGDLVEGVVDGVGDTVEGVTDKVGLGDVGEAVDDVTDNVGSGVDDAVDGLADGVDGLGDGVGDVVDTITGETGGDNTTGDALDDTVDGVAGLLGGSNGGSNGGTNGGSNGGTNGGSNGGTNGGTNASFNGGGLFGFLAGNSRANCREFGNSRNYDGLRVVDQNGVVVGQVMGTAINNDLSIKAVRILTTSEINGSRRCLTIRGGEITAQNGVVMLPVDQTRLIQATMNR